MKSLTFFLLACLFLTACGLKKPLQDPDTVYPAEADCTSNNESPAEVNTRH